MADIKPMLNELKSKIPSKQQVLDMIENMDLNITIDTKKMRERGEKVQSQIVTFAKVTAENPKVQTYTKNVLSSDVTERAIIKLKEVLPNQGLLDKLDEMRLSIIKEKEDVEPSEANQTAQTEPHLKVAPVENVSLAEEALKQDKAEPTQEKASVSVKSAAQSAAEAAQSTILNNTDEEDTSSKS